MSADAALEVAGLRRTYGARVALAGLDLCVQQGDVYGFLGPNGAGKTTALRCVLGLIRPDAGTVAIFGDTDPVRQRRHVGALVETPRFHGWLSGRRNLELACAYAGLPTSAVDPALELVGLRERGGDRVAGYSLGMKQRLGVARALLGEPKLLLLDEPTNGLDPAGMRDVRELVRRMAREKSITVLVSSHLLAEVESIATRVGILKDGLLLAEGEVTQLLRGGDVVEVGSSDRAALEGALAGLDGADVVGDAESGRVRVALDGLSPEALNAALVAAGVPVGELVVARRSLEDLFLSLTGGVV